MRRLPPPPAPAPGMVCYLHVRTYKYKLVGDHRRDAGVIPPPVGE